VVIEDGVATTLIEVTANVPPVTAIDADPDTLVYPAWVECAVQLPVPDPDGVNTPPEVIVPPIAVHVTTEL
jgi:hypothetical protein